MIILSKDIFIILMLLLVHLQINLDEFADLVNAIALRFQKESVSPLTWGLNSVFAFFCGLDENMKIFYLHSDTVFCFAVTYFWKLSNFLPLACLWEAERLCSKPHIWLHSSVHPHLEFCGCRYWDNGMTFSQVVSEIVVKT